MEFIKVYLDDVRTAPSGWFRTTTVADTIYMLEKNNIEYLSLDHDLGNADPHNDGHDVLVWMEKAVFEGNLTKIPYIQIHSANPVGRNEMIKAIDSIHRIHQSRKN